MKKLLVLTLLAAAMLGIVLIKSARTAPLDSRAFMRAKLEHSQQLLTALAVEDYKGIALHSGQLKLLSLDANWQVLQTPDYTRHSADFRRACDQLTQSAEAKNLDGASLAYIQVTLGCVNCHKHVRDVQGKD